MTDLTPWRDLGEDPPPPTATVRAQVQRRAKRIVVRRRIAVAAAAFLVLAGGGGVATLAGTERRATPDTVHVDEPAPTPPPGCATFACPEKERPPGPDCEDRQFDYCPDGRPGWSTGSTGCFPTESLDSSQGTRLPAPGVAMQLELDDTSVPAGSSARARLVVRNDRQDRVRFSVSPSPLGHSLEARALGPGGGNARHASDVGRRMWFDLDPGESDALDLIVPTVACADIYGMKEPPLSPGRYDVSLRLVWDQLVVGDPSLTTLSVVLGYWTGTAELEVTG